MTRSATGCRCAVGRGNTTRTATVRSIAEEWKTLLDRQSAMADSAVTTTYCLRLDAGDGERVLWSQTKSAPEVPSPLIYDGRVYLVSERGILTCRDVKTGKELYRERLNTRGTCYASPVGGDGVVIVASDGGTVLVLKAGDKFEPISRAQFTESILATPALVDSKIYLRHRSPVVCNRKMISRSVRSLSWSPAPQRRREGRIARDHRTGLGS